MSCIPASCLPFLSPLPPEPLPPEPLPLEPPPPENVAMPLASLALSSLDSLPPSMMAWHEGMVLADLSHRLTRTLAAMEGYGLAAQIRWVATLVPANIAEGLAWGTSSSGLKRETTESSWQRAYAALWELKTSLNVAVHTELVDLETVTPLLQQCDRVAELLREMMVVPLMAA